jgi:hypothetical protein
MSTVRIYISINRAADMSTVCTQDSIVKYSVYSVYTVCIQCVCSAVYIYIYIYIHLYTFIYIYIYSVLVHTHLFIAHLLEAMVKMTRNTK